MAAQAGLQLLQTLLVGLPLQAYTLRRANSAGIVKDESFWPDNPTADESDLYTDFSVYDHSPLFAHRESERDRPKLPSESNDTKLLFFTHHKTGTFLARQLASSLSDILGMEVKLRVDGRRVHPCNYSARVAHYQNMHEKDIQVLRRWCPNFRAVHLLRSPLSLLASSYLYHSRNGDTYGMPTGPKKLANKSTYDGLRMEAKAIVFPEPGRRGVLREMLAVHELVKDDPRVLETDLGSFGADFDGTSREVFTHLLGHDYPIESLVKANRASDVSRWKPERLAEDSHVTEKRMKKTVTKAIAHLLEIGDRDVLKVQSFSFPLGYDHNMTAAMLNVS